MVSISFTTDHKLPVIFVPHGVKLNAVRYQCDILDVMLPQLGENLPDYIFQQDGAPAHTARSTVEYLEAQCPGRFIEPTMWPPSSPDLNPCDYYLWSALEQKVYRGQVVRDVEDLRAKIVSAWQEFPQAALEAAILRWRPRLRAVSRAHGGYVEHIMH